jgi:hypothetical protein
VHGCKVCTAARCARLQGVHGCKVCTAERCARRPVILSAAKEPEHNMNDNLLGA